MAILSKSEKERLEAELKRPYREIIGEEEASYLEGFVEKDSGGEVRSIDWKRFYEENEQCDDREQRFFILLSDMGVLSPDPHMNYYIHEGSLYIGPWDITPLYFTRPDLAREFVLNAPGMIRSPSTCIIGPDYSETFRR